MPVSAESIATFARLLGERSRVAMCLALLDGRAWTATELARHVEVAPSTASAHLSALVAAGVLAEERQGRHRYVRLAGPEVATVLEDLAAMAGEPPTPTSLRSVRNGNRLAAARTCYDHLAGALGVNLFDGLVAAGFLITVDGLTLTPPGRRWFMDLSGEPVSAGVSPRPFARTCLDWTERRSHLGGHLGALLLKGALDRRWVTPVAFQPRALTLTAVGQREFAHLLA